MLTLLLKKKKKISTILNTFSAKRKAITLVNIPRKKNKKLVLVLATSISMIAAREEAVKNAKNGNKAENDENGKYLKTNLVWVLYIKYFIIF